MDCCGLFWLGLTVVEVTALKVVEKVVVAAAATLKIAVLGTG